MDEKIIHDAFEIWLAEMFEDGVGNGYGGSFSQDDMESAFRSGLLWQEQQKTMPESLVTKDEKRSYG